MNSVSNIDTLSIIDKAVRLGFEFSDMQEVQDVRYAAEEFIKLQKNKCLPGQKVSFKILKIEDTVKQGSEVELNKTFIGEISKNLNEVYFTDAAACDWIFYIGDTCELIEILD